MDSEKKSMQFCTVFLDETTGIMEYINDTENSKDPLNISSEFEDESGQMVEAPDAEIFVEIGDTTCQGTNLNL